MTPLAVILARAGSKGLPDKCVRPLLGQPVIVYTIIQAQGSRRLDGIVLSTDSPRAAALGREAGIMVVSRPCELATDTARVDEVVRHAVDWFERQAQERADPVVILYGNVPVRAPGVIDRCVDHLLGTGCDSVRTVAPVTKQHPDWIHRLVGDRLVQFRPNSIHRRQDLEPLYYHDGAVVAVRREALFAAAGSPDPHAFFGTDRRAVVQAPEDTVEIDGPVDLCLAEALLRVHRRENDASHTPGALAEQQAMDRTPEPGEMADAASSPELAGVPTGVAAAPQASRSAGLRKPRPAEEIRGLTTASKAACGL